MVKRDKRLKKSIESISEEIEKHFQKLEKDISEKDEIMARYHIKEIDTSLINALEKKIVQLDETSKENKELIDSFKEKLQRFKEQLDHE